MVVEILRHIRMISNSDSVHSLSLFSAAPLGIHTVRHLDPHSHYPDTELTSPYPILLMLNARLRSNNYQSIKVSIL